MKTSCPKCSCPQDEGTQKCAHCLINPDNGSVRAFWHKVCVGLWVLFNILMWIAKKQNPPLTEEELRSMGDPTAFFAIMFDGMTQGIIIFVWIIGNVILGLIVGLTEPDS